jgi:hypothetical protein
MHQVGRRGLVAVVCGYRLTAVSVCARGFLISNALFPVLCFRIYFVAYFMNLNLKITVYINESYQKFLAHELKNEYYYGSFIHSFIHSTGLQLFIGPWPPPFFFSFVILYIVGRTPRTGGGDQFVARPLPIQRTTETQNKRTQISMP